MNVDRIMGVLRGSLDNSLTARYTVPVNEIFSKNEFKESNIVNKIRNVNRLSRIYHHLFITPLRKIEEYIICVQPQ